MEDCHGAINCHQIVLELVVCSYGDDAISELGASGVQDLTKSLNTHLQYEEPIKEVS